MNMFQKATRRQVPLKLGITGPSGSGKTTGSLNLMRGLVGPEGRIALCDTENGSASLYAHITDFDVIRDVVLREIMPRYRIDQAGFDPWHARQFVTALQSDGMECVEVRQGFQTLSPASKLFEALVGARRLTHDGNPVLAWCVANAELVTDPAGNIKPVKPGGDARSSRKIDGVTATLTGLARLMVAPVAAPRRAHVSAI